MAWILFFLLLGLVFGLVAVACNPSPYFAALGLVVVSGFGCGVLVGHGGAFLPLILFLIYLGGMLVVFAYSAALAAEPYPESLGSRRIIMAMVIYCLGVSLAGGYLYGGWYETSWMTVEESGEFSMSRGDIDGIAMLYSHGGLLLLIAAAVLLLTLFVVLELSRGANRGTLRAV
uniref:NADH-ubiquinone oxidoreductase chain 6 n=2 Tax=Nemipterus TaxID=119724 RepID=A0A0K1HRV6_9TELE|nr:NADH dehydrogenase subunit 6 [Nemipterus japonicus]YP_009163107.1 NADH dehydrogenase subunit 6 [Nemipterus virgatus]AHN94323.1 NADH dehydrogenase subunit 6 [Nemipterus japonicus]AKT94790.1 NADH dehydrogenase subunit 6 [Nemipterus virgatus]AOV85526.1 NADH dehydrogenase subunit 6 [Nemipterus virgatus]